MKEYLKEILDNYGIDSKGKSVYEYFKTKASISDIRDFLCANGNIIIENLNGFLYIATISGGFKNMNYAITVLKLENEKLHIYAVAKEGLINQHTSKNVIDKIKAEFLNDK